VTDGPLPPGSPWIVGALSGLLTTAAWAFGRRGVAKVDALAEAQKHFVTNEDLTIKLDGLHSDRMRMHAENLSAMTEIRSSIERVHTRVDQVFTRQDRRPRR